MGAELRKWWRGGRGGWSDHEQGVLRAQTSFNFCSKFMHVSLVKPFVSSRLIFFFVEEIEDCNLAELKVGHWEIHLHWQLNVLSFSLIHDTVNNNHKYRQS
jgi:hypothetical protein